MELGKLATSSGAGDIFYFIIDETRPDAPREEKLRYFYVVSPSSSYKEAFCFLCHALCFGESDGEARSKPRLKRWCALYSRIFGSISQEEFVAQVMATPRWDRDKRGIVSVPRAVGAAPPPIMPSLHQDETSARLALEALSQRQSRSQEREAISARQQNSYTPEDTKTAPRLSARAPATAAAATLSHNLLTSSMSGERDRLGDVSNGDSSIPAAAHTPEASALEKPWQHMTRQEAWQADQLWKATLQYLKETSEKETAQLRAEIERLRGEMGFVSTAQAPSRRDAQSVSVGGAKPNSSGTDVKGDMHEASQETISVLKSQLKETRTQLQDAQEARKREAGEYKVEMDKMQERLRSLSHEHGEKLHALVRENQSTVQRIELELKKKEEELKGMYDDALQQRDVRLAQTSEELLHTQHQARLTSVQVSELERRAAEEQRHASELMGRYRDENALLQQQLHASRADLARIHAQYATLSMNAATATQKSSTSMVATAMPSLSPVANDIYEYRYCALYRDYERLQHVASTLESDLVSARQYIASQQAELQRATSVINSLKEGLMNVKTELPALRREREIC